MLQKVTQEFQGSRADSPSLKILRGTLAVFPQLNYGFAFLTLFSTRSELRVT